ncbi:MAG: acyl--CoA ligase [Hyphomicrobiales bacterium]|nr:acyl--CoA ligase [Hyphomicrobiales bacterium]
MLEWLPATAAIADERTGVAFDAAGLTAAVLARETTLHECSVAAGTRVVIAHEQAAGLIVDLLATWRLGAAAVVVSAALTPPERANVTALTGPVLWIGDGAAAGVHRLAPQCPRANAAQAEPIRLAAAELDAPALILVTSGTTARPKAVVHSHRSLQSRLALNLAHIDRRDLARSLAVLPLHFGHGLIGNCLTVLAAGGHLTLWPEPGLAGFAALGRLIEARRITFMSSVPAMWRVVLRASSPPKPGVLRRVHIGSAPLSLSLWQDIAAWCATRRALNVYGTTETANWIGGYSLEDGDASDGLVGRPWGGMLKVVTAEGFQDAGEGEVAVATPSLMMGYLDQPELTAGVVRGGYFLTGDTGILDQEGRLRLIGRRAHEVNRGGVKIALEEVDRLLEQHPAVAEACAFALDDPAAGEIVAAAVVAWPPGAITDADLQAWCEARIRKEAVPARIVFAPSLARSERGKLNRDAVRAALLGSTRGGAS